MDSRLTVPKNVLMILNQLYEIEQKLKKHGDSANVSRNVERVRDAFAEEGLPDGANGTVRLTYEDPMGQSFKETRTDVAATIAGSGTENLVVVEVIKPIIRASVREGVSHVVQQGIVIVESRKEQNP